MENRIAEMRNKKGMTQKDLASALNVAQQTVWYYENGQRDIKASTLIAISEILGCTVSQLLGIENVDGVLAASKSGSKMVPVVGRVAAGTPREALQVSDQYHATEESLYSAHPNAFWLRVSGNSMNRLFPDGALVLIDPDEEVRNGDVAVVFVNGDDATLKRIYFEGHSVRLHPESFDSEYMDRIIDGSDANAPDVRLLGKAVSYTAPEGWRA